MFDFLIYKSQGILIMRIDYLNFIQKNNNTVVFRGYKNTNGPKVSVILPIYNQEKYLPTALNSLQNQTLEDTEFICVNDGSDATKDNSLEILNKYAREDKRVKIIHQKNQGAGVARNNGIKLARGEYIAFLDPDDWFEKEALQKIYLQSKEQDCDMLVFNFNKIDEKSGKFLPPMNIAERIRKYNPTLDLNNTFNWRDIKPGVFRSLLWMAWNKLYNREFVNKNDLHFSKSSLAEDNIFVFDATLKARKIGYSDQTLYNYLQHEGSALRQKSDKNFCIFKAIDAVNKSLKNLNLTEELSKEFDDYVVKLLSIHSEQILSKDKLKCVCEKRLTSNQLKMLRELRIL